MTSTAASARLPWWLPAPVILGAALTAAGGVIALVHPALLLSSGDQMNSAAHLYAHYLVSRNLSPWPPRWWPRSSCAPTARSPV